MNERLMRALLDQAAFLELSGDDVIAPDAAVRQLEEIAAAMQSLLPEERAALLACSRRLADEERERNGDAPRVHFLMSIGQRLGLE